ncbi:MAG: hypothetical protein HQK66_14500 [Desulfamplus sp.]|nr:hypothetical protein [Desulfamplus sp.]
MLSDIIKKEISEGWLQVDRIYDGESPTSVGFYEIYVSIFESWLSKNEYKSITEDIAIGMDYVKKNTELFQMLRGPLVRINNQKMKVITSGQVSSYFSQACSMNTKFPDFCLPNLGVYVCGGFDFKYSIFIRIEASISIIKNAVTKCGLNILPSPEFQPITSPKPDQTNPNP